MVLSSMNLDGKDKATASGWEQPAESQVAMEIACWPRRDSGDCLYLNSATCPDCAAGMISQGGCFVCPACGFESCLV